MPEQNKKSLIVITYPDGQTVTLDAERGQWDGYSYDGAAFIVRHGGDLVGLYNFVHVRSIEVRAAKKEAEKVG